MSTRTESRYLDRQNPLAAPAQPVLPSGMAVESNAQERSELVLHQASDHSLNGDIDNLTDPGRSTAKAPRSLVSKPVTRRVTAAGKARRADAGNRINTTPGQSMRAT